MYKIKLRRVSNVPNQQMRFEGDACIMVSVCAKCKWELSSIGSFNYCRLFLGVELLSDIITADGTTIRQILWKGHKDENLCSGNEEYFHQPRPSEKMWIVWRKILRNVYDCNEYGKLLRRTGKIQMSEN
jgi:hypothetical protein